MDGGDIDRGKVREELEKKRRKWDKYTTNTLVIVLLLLLLLLYMTPWWHSRYNKSYMRFDHSREREDEENQQQ